MLGRARFRRMSHPTRLSFLGRVVRPLQPAIASGRNGISMARPRPEDLSSYFPPLRTPLNPGYLQDQHSSKLSLVELRRFREYGISSYQNHVGHS